MEVWRRMSSNPDKYLREVNITVPEVLTMKGSHVVFSDYTFLVMVARDTGLCNWGLLEERYLPLGFGVAFVEGSPYKKFIDEM